MEDTSFISVIEKVDRINEQMRDAAVGLTQTEWFYIDKLRDDPLTNFSAYIDAVNELHYHVESILNFVNAMNEDLGITPLNDC